MLVLHPRQRTSPLLRYVLVSFLWFLYLSENSMFVTGSFVISGVIAILLRRVLKVCSLFAGLGRFGS